MITTTWHMLAAPAGLPREIVGALNREVVKIVERPDIRRHFEIDAAETKAMTPAELKEFVRGEVEKWTPVVQAAMKTDDRAHAPETTTTKSSPAARAATQRSATTRIRSSDPTLVPPNL